MTVNLTQLVEIIQNAKLPAPNARYPNELQDLVDSVRHYETGKIKSPYQEQENLTQIVDYLGRSISVAIGTNDKLTASTLNSILPDLLKAGTDPNSPENNMFLWLLLEKLQEEVTNRTVFEESDRVREALPKVAALMSLGFYQQALTELEAIAKHNYSPRLELLQFLLGKTINTANFKRDNLFIQRFETKFPELLAAAKETFETWKPEHSRSLNAVNDAFFRIDQLSNIARYHENDKLRQEALSALKGIEQLNNLPPFIHNRIQNSPALKAQSAPGRLENPPPVASAKATTTVWTGAIPDKKKADEAKKKEAEIKATPSEPKMFGTVTDIKQWSAMLAKNPNDSTALGSVDYYIKTIASFLDSPVEVERKLAEGSIKKLQQDKSLPQVVHDILTQTLKGANQETKSQTRRATQTSWTIYKLHEEPLNEATGAAQSIRNLVPKYRIDTTAPQKVVVHLKKLNNLALDDKNPNLQNEAIAALKDLAESKNIPTKIKEQMKELTAFKEIPALKESVQEVQIQKKPTP